MQTAASVFRKIHNIPKLLCNINGIWAYAIDFVKEM